MTINSPMLGMASAAKGVQFSPVVVPAWRDVATKSKFIGRLYSSPWPAAIPYHLVFAYETGKDSDGVVSLASQIPLSLQNEASEVRGFVGGHAGLLADSAFIDYFNRVLVRREAAVARP
jgi:hypothetical protein